MDAVAPSDDEQTPELECAIYTVADARFFVGAVALLNSLRLSGHDEPLFLVDCGLTDRQRERLAGHVTFVLAPDDHAVFLTPFGPTAHPARVALALDADLIVLRPLTELVAAARAGRVVAFVEPPPTDDRSFDTWSAALELPPVRRQPYVNAGQLVFPHELGRRLLSLWADGQRRVPVSATRYGDGKIRLDDPFYFADQDVLNAVLATRFEPAELELLDYRYAPHVPFEGLTVLDEMNLDCRYADGERPFLLHHILAKPWLKATRTSAYSRLLTRLLLSPDVAVRLEPEELPLRLRQGRLAALDRRRADAQAAALAEARRQAGRFGIRTRIRNWRRRRRASA